MCKIAHVSFLYISPDGIPLIFSQLYFKVLSIYIVQCTKYEACAKLHMIHILYISPGGIPLMFSQLYSIVLSIYVVQCTKYETYAKLHMFIFCTFHTVVYL